MRYEAELKRGPLDVKREETFPAPKNFMPAPVIEPIR